MKNLATLSFLLILVLVSCGPGQRITNSWINPESPGNAPYESIFLIVLSPSKETSFSVEDHLAGVIAERGQKYVLASSVFPPNISISENFTREQMAEAIRRTGCDAVLMLALLDVKEVETYHPGTAWTPGYFAQYNYYYGYYNYYYPQISSPGYYSSDKTYYIETNFFDVETGEHLWLIQSEAYNPSSLESWFDTYIYQLMDELRKESLIVE